ncbi:ABC transporter permease [Streptomyces sp. C10-9-1]|uniref:ABC transporter permease n=1 Tax=Streptomyces sp. C10-9-1 TaxID=1859285 RepID=UPI003D7196AC
MFVAWRDLRTAKGRFALMGTVIVLVTLLVGLLSGLTAGLARENVSGVTGLPADRLVFAAPPDGRSPSFSDSAVSEGQWRSWAQRPGVVDAAPLGVRTTEAAAAPGPGGGDPGGGAARVAVAAFGAEPGGRLAPGGLAPGRVVLSTRAAEELGVRVGDRVRLGPGTAAVAAVDGDASHAHLPVVWTALQDWRRLPGAPGGATVIALTTGEGFTPAASDAADEALGTTALTVDEALAAVGSYQAENGSLQLMRGFLFAISALVVGAFFTVWTVQRAPEIAVLKALGASTGYLLRDALGQALLVLTAGTLAGTALAAGAGLLIGRSEVPFAVEPATVLVPAAVTVVLGAAGAALSVRRITAVDPLTALGSAR